MQITRWWGVVYDFARLLATPGGVGGWAAGKRRDWKLGENPGRLRPFTLRWSELFGEKNQGPPCPTGTQTHFAVSHGQFRTDQDAKPSSPHTHGWELAAPRLFL